MLGAKQLRPGVVIIFNGQLHEVVDANHHKPGKGGAFVRTKLRNLASGAIIPETVRPEDTFEQVYIDQKMVQYLFKDDMGYCVMDETTYEQFYIPVNVMGDTAEYLKDNMRITVNFHDNKLLSVTMPIHVVLKVIETEPGFKGNTVTGANKPAKVESGKTVRVPLFVNAGDVIKIDTRTGEYIERV
ncbi:MAG: elongation factor P [Candidatus Omnitrophica bacterium]|nr:elongation factor P [Candidatus Omnitrophota bacterium]